MYDVVMNPQILVCSADTYNTVSVLRFGFLKVALEVNDISCIQLYFRW